MLYELHLNIPSGESLTAEQLLDALANSGAAWESVETDEPAALCLICTSSAYAWEIVVQGDLLTVSLPVNLMGQAARDAFDLAWRAVRCLQLLVPSPLFDPQIGAQILPDSPFDTEKVLMTYAGLVRHLQSFEL